MLQHTHTHTQRTHAHAVAVAVVVVVAVVSRLCLSPFFWAGCYYFHILRWDFLSLTNCFCYRCRVDADVELNALSKRGVTPLPSPLHDALSPLSLSLCMPGSLARLQLTYHTLHGRSIDRSARPVAAPFATFVTLYRNDFVIINFYCRRP